MSVRVLIMSRQTLAAECLAHVLSQIDAVGEIGVVATGQVMLDQAARMRPRVCLMAVDPMKEDFMFATRLSEDQPNCSTAVISSRREAAAVRRVINAGLRGYLTHDAEVCELSHAIQRLSAGHLMFSDRVVINAGEAGVPVPRWDALSDREVEVLRDVANGLSSKESADRLSISSKTVDAHRRRVQSKLALATPAEMTRVSVAEGLVGNAWLAEGPEKSLVDPMFG